MSMPKGREVLSRLMCHIDFGKPVNIPCCHSETLSCYRTACAAVNGVHTRGDLEQTPHLKEGRKGANYALNDGDGLLGQIVICTILTTSTTAASQMALFALFLLNAKTVPSNPNEEGRDGGPYHQDS